MTQKAQVNRELTSSREPEANLFLHGNQNTKKLASNKSVNNKQVVRKKTTLSSLRSFPYEPIYDSWYHTENPILFKQILNELGVKTDHTYVLKLLYPAADIIRRFDLAEQYFLRALKHFYREYVNYNLDKPTPIPEQFDDYLCRWAWTVWPRALDEIRRHSVTD